MSMSSNFIREAEPRISVSKTGRIRKHLTVEMCCVRCEKNFICLRSNTLKPNRGQYCSRKCSNRAKFPNSVEGGNTHHPLYNRWLILSQRTENINDSNYIHYGARGIKVETYLKNFRNYLEYVMSLPNAPESFPTKLEIDRIDNNKGYERGNLRWATRSLNVINTRPKQVKKIGKYPNVFYLKRDRKWKVDIRYEGIKHSLGTFDTEEQARQARNQFIIENNFPHQIV